MEIEIDHYEFLGLASGEEGSKLTIAEISKAYRSKALELHPDKRPNDPNAHDEFQKLKSSYEILKDEKARKLFDDLRVKLAQRKRKTEYDFKRRKGISDLEERERAASVVTPDSKARDEEERIVRQFRQEIERIRVMRRNKDMGVGVVGTPKTAETKTPSVGGEGGLERDKILKVSWEGNEDDYSAQKLRDLFQEFGDVEDVLTGSRGSLKKRRRTRSALVVMASKDAAVSAMGSLCGDLWNPLLVMPLHKAKSPDFTSPLPTWHVEPDDPVVNNLVGASYMANEASILEKMRKAAEKQK